MKASSRGGLGLPMSCMLRKAWSRSLSLGLKRKLNFRKCGAGPASTWEDRRAGEGLWGSLGLIFMGGMLYSGLSQTFRNSLGNDQEPTAN